MVMQMLWVGCPYRWCPMLFHFQAKRSCWWNTWKGHPYIVVKSKSGPREIQFSHRCYASPYKDGRRQIARSSWTLSSVRRLNWAWKMAVCFGEPEWLCSPPREIKNTHRVTWSSPRRIPNESACTKLCVVAGHGPGHREGSKTLRQMSVTPTCTSRSATSPLGVARTPMVETSHWLCRALQGRDVSRGGRCLFKMVRCSLYEVYYIHCHNWETEGNICNTWFTGNSCQWQWQ